MIARKFNTKRKDYILKSKLIQILNFYNNIIFVKFIVLFMNIFFLIFVHNFRFHRRFKRIEIMKQFDSLYQ